MDTNRSWLNRQKNFTSDGEVGRNGRPEVTLMVDCMEYDAHDAYASLGAAEGIEKDFMEEFLVEDYTDLEMESFELNQDSPKKFGVKG